MCESRAAIVTACWSYNPSYVTVPGSFPSLVGSSLPDLRLPACAQTMRKPRHRAEATHGRGASPQFALQAFADLRDFGQGYRLTWQRLQEGAHAPRAEAAEDMVTDLVFTTVFRSAGLACS